MGNPLQTYIKDDYEIGLEEGYQKGWAECKKKILKELKPLEGEYVCDVIDRIKEL